VGVVIAPSGFGAYSGDLLVGNFGNGEINAFNPTTGAYLGTLDGPGGTPLVNQDLWALAVSPSGGNAVYFTAGSMVSSRACLVTSRSRQNPVRSLLWSELHWARAGLETQAPFIT